MKPRALVALAYIFEIGLSVFLFGLLFIIWDAKQLVAFMHQSASDFATYFSAAMLAGSIAFLWQFYSKSDTPFAMWLYAKDAFKVYLMAYVYAVAVYALLTVALLLSKHIASEFVSYIAIWALILGVLNVYTFIKNIIDQLLLNMEFNKVNGQKML